MSYILYGGIFDPAHIGHLKIAEAAYDKIDPEILIWIPAKYPPHRTVKGLPSTQRVQMLKSWFKNRPRYGVSDIEVKDSHSGYSIETIERFKKKYSYQDSFFLIGNDEAENFKNWRNWKKILQLTTIIIGARIQAAKIPEELRRKAVFLDNKIYEVSSTELRNKLKKNKSIEGLIDKIILKYIEREGLYK